MKIVITIFITFVLIMFIALTIRVGGKQFSLDVKQIESDIEVIEQDDNITLEEDKEVVEVVKLTRDDLFRLASEKYNVEYELLMAISIHETGHFTSSAFKNKNNVGGNMTSKGLRSFKTLEEGIMFFARNLRVGYLDKGLTTISQIQKKYCPIGADNDPNGLNHHWYKGVTKQYNKLKEINK